MQRAIPRNSLEKNTTNKRKPVNFKANRSLFDDRSEKGSVPPGNRQGNFNEVCFFIFMLLIFGISKEIYFFKESEGPNYESDANNEDLGDEQNVNVLSETFLEKKN